jgi:hypothetical protein
MFGSLRMKVPSQPALKFRSGADAGFEFDAVNETFEAFDVITGEALGFKAVKEVGAQIRVLATLFQ